MLVLTRKKNESIIILVWNKEKIMGEIEVIVTDIRGDKVRLGFEAPPEISIHRKEVWEAMKREEMKKAPEYFL